MSAATHAPAAAGTPGPGATEALLRIDNLSAGYGAFQVLFDVSLEVKAGESVAVIGPNGAGKTSSFNALTGRLPVRGGRLRLGGEVQEGWQLLSLQPRSAVVRAGSPTFRLPMSQMTNRSHAKSSGCASTNASRNFSGLPAPSTSPKCRYT